MSSSSVHTDRRSSSARRRRTRRLAAAAVVVVAVTACGGDTDDATPVAADVDVAPGLVTPAESARLADDGVTVIDIRTPEEFAAGHLADATLIDFYEADFADRIAELPTDEPYLVYCRSGNRSAQATRLMDELGFEQVYEMDGGIVAYAEAGLPLAP
jgi:phage shock protein E